MGAFSAWQPVDLETHTEVIPDLNGPGCDCYYSTASAEPILVPVDARTLAE